jgi:hypothetical protein
MAIVGNQKGNTRFLRKLDEDGVDNPLFFEAVILELQVEAVSSEEVSQFVNAVSGFLDFPTEHELKDLPLDSSR